MTQHYIQDHISSLTMRDASSSTVLSVSEDGYVRLSFDELKPIVLDHFLSGLDEDIPNTSNASHAAVITVITGYTEWLSATSPIITMGWDWQMGVMGNRILLRKVGEPRSNLMLQDSERCDVGPAKTAILLGIFVDSLDWQLPTQQYINHSYGHS